MSGEGIGARLVQAMGDESMRSLSQRAEIPYSTLRQYCTAGTEPLASNAHKLANVLGVSLEWLISGTGEMRPHSTQGQSQANSLELWPIATQEEPTRLPIDEKFMARVAVAVSDAYREAGQPVSDAATGMEIHRMLTAILQEARHPEEYEAQLALEKLRLRRRLAEARAQPGLGKASA